MLNQGLKEMSSEDLYLLFLLGLSEPSSMILKGSMEESLDQSFKHIIYKNNNNNKN